MLRLHWRLRMRYSAVLWYREREHDEGSLSAGYPAADVLFYDD